MAGLVTCGLALGGRGSQASDLLLATSSKPKRQQFSLKEQGMNFLWPSNHNLEFLLVSLGMELWPS